MKNKSRISGLKTRYIKIPNSVLKIGLNPIVLSVYLVLCSYSEDYNPKLSNIALTLGIHKNTVCRAMKTLCDLGVIKKIKQGHVNRLGNSQTPSEESCQSLYEFTNPETWTKIVKPSKSLTETQNDTVEITKKDLA